MLRYLSKANKISKIFLINLKYKTYLVPIREREKKVNPYGDIGTPQKKGNQSKNREKKQIFGCVGDNMKKRKMQCFKGVGSTKNQIIHFKKYVHVQSHFMIKT